MFSDLKVEIYTDNVFVLVFFGNDGFPFFFSICHNRQVLDKDGVTASVRASELILHSSSDETVLTLSGRLNWMDGRYGYHCSRGSYLAIKCRERADGIFHRMRRWDGGREDTVCEEKN